jgi:hypothetical protein
MRTTVDIPNAVFMRAKLRAVHEGVTLKDIVTRALERDLDAPANDADTRRPRASRLFAALDQSRNTQPVGRLNRDEIYDRSVLR